MLRRQSRWLATLDKFLISEMHRWSIPILRIALGIVFFWFGVLKIFGVSPVEELIRHTYSFLPQEELLMALGVCEAAIGAGLILKRMLRATLALLWLQMAGTLVAPLFAPSMFFHGGNIFLLTMEGEFVAKNVVLIAASLVVGGYEIGRKRALF
jgi:uncharacterized membrane protein YkgB